MNQFRAMCLPQANKQDKRMIIVNGFSITEVLIALLLVSGASLALLQQQSQSHQHTQLAFKKAEIWLEEENSAESFEINEHA